MHLAYCSEIDAFKNDRLRDKEWSYQFPGSGWVTSLYQIAEKSGINVVSGDIALNNVISKKWDAKDVFVIQEMESSDALKLLEYGARPFLITCLEASLYAPFFYDNIKRISKKFQYSLGYGFIESDKNLKFRFPSFFIDDLRKIQSWTDRRNLVLVAANKYKSKYFFMPNKMNFMIFLRQLKSFCLQLVSPEYRKSLSMGLHNHRLESIEYFASKGELDLYGAGWECLGNLPASWETRLKSIVYEQYLGRCKDKLQVISDYRFSICFENMAAPGYVTEKIVDCFVAGSIPLYLGAPDVEDLIPQQAFIDVRKYNSFEDLNSFISSIKENEAQEMINAGRRYLHSELGMLHSYEGFAKNIMMLIKKC